MVDIMARNSSDRLRADLNIRALSDPKRHAIAANVAQLAPTSSLVGGNTSIQASVASLAKKDTALAQSNTTVVNDRQKLRADTEAEGMARSAFDGELHNLATLTGNAAQTTADIAAVGLTPYVPPPVTKGAPQVPTGIDVKYPRTGHGTATAAVQQPKGAQWQFLVQWSPDPVGATTWALLVGTGKTRTLTGASGTKVWVRAARVRGQLQSDFCTPVLITIP
jgi:hypothetical protein